MQKILFFFLFLCFGTFLTAQQTHEFSYDAAGNRIERKLIRLSQRAAHYMQTPAQEETLTPEETRKPEVLPEDEPAQSSFLLSYKINVYPNPTKGRLKIEIIGSEEIRSLSTEVYTANGKSIYSIRKPSRELEVDLSSFPNGIYIMRMILNGKPSEWKIIKE